MPTYCREEASFPRSVLVLPAPSLLSWPAPFLPRRECRAVVRVCADKLPQPLRGGLALPARGAPSPPHWRRRCGGSNPTVPSNRARPAKLRAMLLAPVKGVFASITLALNVLIGVSAMIPFALAKLLLPFTAVRHVTDRALNAIATEWIAVNNWWIGVVGDVRWDLVASNHQSWVDILVLQKVFNRRIPLLKFFLKRQLIYVPVIGLAWWALDFPFMQRKGGASGPKDLERARKACEKFRVVPTSVINFLEGTRYTPDKHDKQRSPFNHLLKPKVGGIATALTTLGAQFHRLLDVTIVYPDGPPTFWDILSGRVHAVTVRVQQREIPAELLEGDYLGDKAFRGRMQEWVNSLWVEKDALLTQLKPPAAAAR
jgi:1-acyl-sn-glycerol-3-phosphate acyltransferase